MNRHIINISEGMGYAKPMVTRFSSGFDTVAFVIDTKEDISHCAFALAVSAGGDCFMLTEDGEALVRGEENQKLCVEWSIGREITAKDGIVIYQLIAYTGDENGNNESIWYSPEGRLVVGESIELTEYEAAQIGSQPSVVMQILSKMHNCEANIEKLEKDAQAHASAKILDHPDKSVTPEKLSDALAEILNGAATKDYVTSQTNPLSERLDEAQADIDNCKNRVDKLEMDYADTSETAHEAWNYAVESSHSLSNLGMTVSSIGNNLEKCKENAVPTMIVSSAQGEYIKIDDSSELEMSLNSIYGKSVYTDGEELDLSPDNPANIEHIEPGQEIGIDVKTKNLFDTEKFIELIKSYDVTAFEETLEGRRCIRFNIQALYKKDFSSAISLGKNKIYTWSMDVKFAMKKNEMSQNDCWFSFGWLYNNEVATETNIGNTVFQVPLKNRRQIHSMYDFNSFGKISVTSYLSNNTCATGVAFSYNDRGYWYIDLDSIQIEEGGEISEYTPYRYNGGKVTSPIQLRGVPVTSNGNYTDSSGMQWIADEINFDNKYYIKRVKEFYPSDIFNIMEYDTADDGRTIFLGEGKTGGEFECLPYGGLCNIAKNNHLHSHKDDDWIFTLITTPDGLCTYTISGPASSVSDFEEKAKTAVYLLPLIKPEKIYMDLSEDVKLPVLKSYTPTTCIKNDKDICMGFSYVADTKNYIDKKINDISQMIAILGSQVIG